MKINQNERKRSAQAAMSMVKNKYISAIAPYMFLCTVEWQIQLSIRVAKLFKVLTLQSRFGHIITYSSYCYVASVFRN